VETTISKPTSTGFIIKGYNLEELIGRVSFGDLIYLLMTDSLPKAHEGEMIEAMLVSCVDHGLNAPSVNVTRTIASCGVPVSTAVAAGISAIGEYHGGAGEACGKLLSESLENNPNKDIDEMAEYIVKMFIESKRNIPGLGHRKYKKVDPRAEKLFSLATKWDIVGRATKLIRAIQENWLNQTGNLLSINIDGAQGAILIDLNIPWQQAKGLFLIGRAAGLNAHAIEQIQKGSPFKFAAPIKIKYTGKLPEDSSD
jgi:citryl-CoA lyase